jgi:hypothetical protein
MLDAEECQKRADECARLAEATVNRILIARDRHLETSWLYLFRLKIRARLARAEAAQQSLPQTSPA